MLFLLLIKEKTGGICFTHFLSLGIGEVSSTSLPFPYQSSAQEFQGCTWIFFGVICDPWDLQYSSLFKSFCFFYVYVVVILFFPWIKLFQTSLILIFPFFQIMIMNLTQRKINSELTGFQLINQEKLNHNMYMILIYFFSFLNLHEKDRHSWPLWKSC